MKDLQNIISGCRQQQRHSQEALYKYMYPALFTLCKNFFKDDHDIITALNNGMLKVYKNISQYDDSKGSIFNWIYTIVRNQALTYLKSKKNDLEIKSLDDLNDVPYLNPFKMLEWKDIYFYLNKLPNTTRIVCSLFYFEYFTIKEISINLEMKEGTVRWHLNESRNRLKLLFHCNNKKIG